MNRHSHALDIQSKNQQILQETPISLVDMKIDLSYKWIIIGKKKRDTNTKIVIYKTINLPIYGAESCPMTTKTESTLNSSRYEISKTDDGQNQKGTKRFRETVWTEITAKT